MQRYRVDLTSIEISKREEVFKLLDGYSFFAERIIGSNGLEAAIVNWTSEEVFKKSLVFPKGCDCQLLNY
ncbi:MAG: hypothetical protein K2K35_11305 [Lachnospiraceae bacterium]|nr:hypothetical protein [Lachnospiraceae bacterium]